MLTIAISPYAEANFLDTLANGEFELIHPTVDDVRRMAELVRTYHDLPLGVIPIHRRPALTRR